MGLGNLLFDGLQQWRRARAEQCKQKEVEQAVQAVSTPAPFEVAAAVYDPNALMSTFEDFTFTSDMLQGVECVFDLPGICDGLTGRWMLSPLAAPNYSFLSAENWADMVGDNTYADLQTLWKINTEPA